MSSIDGSGVHLGIDRKFYNEAMEQPWESDFLALARLSLSLFVGHRVSVCLSAFLPACLGICFYRISDVTPALTQGWKEGRKG